SIRRRSASPSATSNGPTNWCRGRSPSIQITRMLTRGKPMYSWSGGTRTKRCRRRNARCPWTRPCQTPMRAWAKHPWRSDALNSLEFFDKAIRLSPRDPALYYLNGAKARAFTKLKQYDQAIESARRAIAINPSNLLSGYESLGLAYFYT